MIDYGLVARWYKISSVGFRAPHCYEVATDLLAGTLTTGPPRLSKESLTGPFVILLVGYTAAIFVFIAEKLGHRYGWNCLCTAILLFSTRTSHYSYYSGLIITLYNNKKWAKSRSARWRGKELLRTVVTFWLSDRLNTLNLMSKFNSAQMVNYRVQNILYSLIIKKNI